VSELHPSFRTVGHPPAPARKSRLIPIALTIFCGALLAGSSCFGFIDTLNINGRSKPINTLFVCGMVAGIVAFLAGTIWGIVALVVHILRPRGQQP
jgi:hypothetical protein